uniref:Uncharacterized protein n=1 Tax=Bionectria ochroleuca TaxID=29856 RepID=A0A0B7K2G0_BIOOC
MGPLLFDKASTYWWSRGVRCSVGQWSGALQTPSVIGVREVVSGVEVEARALLNYGRLEEQLPSITEWLPALDGSILALTLPNL